MLIKGEHAKDLGSFCKSFREEELKISMAEMVRKLNCENQYKNIWAWEHGQSTNLFYLSLYYHATDDTDLKNYFMHGVFNLL